VWPLKRNFSLFLLLLVSWLLFSQDIGPVAGVPLNELSYMKSELMICKQNLTLRDEQLANLQTASDGQQKEIANLLSRSKELQSQIDNSLAQSEISEAQFEQIQTDYNTLLTGLATTVNRLKRQNKILKVGVVVTGVIAFFSGVKVGLSF